ncbi:MAG: phosphoglycerate kinase, partial [Bacteroidota bacterium]|nr:phosphoglycerate kinase [Bacteroidota bacterium]
GKIGNSIVENDYLELAKGIVKKAEEKGVKIHIMTDAIAADAFSNDANTKIVPVDQIEDNWLGLDSGPDSNKAFAEVIKNSGTILWNGPIGVFEMEKFAEGTKSAGAAIVEATKNGAFSLIGGGDSVAAVNQFGFANGVSYISTAGGALLEYLEGRVLPGIAAVRGE